MMLISSPLEAVVDEWVDEFVSYIFGVGFWYQVAFHNAANPITGSSRSLTKNTVNLMVRLVNERSPNSSRMMCNGNGRQI